MIRWISCADDDADGSAVVATASDRLLLLDVRAFAQETFTGTGRLSSDQRLRETRTQTDTHTPLGSHAIY